MSHFEGEGGCPKCIVGNSHNVAVQRVLLALFKPSDENVQIVHKVSSFGSGSPPFPLLAAGFPALPTLSDIGRLIKRGRRAIGK